MDVVIKPPTLRINTWPDAYHHWATHYLKCGREFKSPDKFSPVPYFLFCRAIELEIKARFLKKLTPDKVKNKFWHNLIKAYNNLSKGEKILNKDEEDTLERASIIYNDKGFEYFNTKNALTAYKNFPKLGKLDSVASKLIEKSKIEC